MYILSDNDSVTLN